MDDRRQQGFSLVELLVVMLLVGIVGTVVTTSLVQSMSNTRLTSARAMALHDIERSLQVVGRELRIADPVILDRDGRFDERIAAQVVRNDTVQIHTFTIEREEGDDDEDGIQFLFQSIIEYDRQDLLENGPEDATPITLPRRRLITDIDNGIEAVFTYHDTLGNEVVCDPSVPNECLERFGGANQVGIRLIRNLDDQEPIRAETRVSVRNLRYQRLS